MDGFDSELQQKTMQDVLSLFPCDCDRKLPKWSSWKNVTRIHWSQSLCEFGNFERQREGRTLAQRKVVGESFQALPSGPVYRSPPKEDGCKSRLSRSFKGPASVLHNFIVHIERKFDLDVMKRRYHSFLLIVREKNGVTMVGQCAASFDHRCIWFQKDDGPVSLSARTLRIQVFTSKAVRKSCIFDVVESYGKTRSTLLLLLRLRNSRCALSIVAMLALLNF
ncbi:unnamed protein product [Cylicocyclus nassatus]|uniref:Uncharacterized protein n=1 Tax=Cylicocyclus nassatus TaxID=53992 RepID=A0AA36GNP1_CYLNA|nr:unnamed protein product [Cylicocyclus nassatus]